MLFAMPMNIFWGKTLVWMLSCFVNIIDGGYVFPKDNNIKYEKIANDYSSLLQDDAFVRFEQCFKRINIINFSNKVSLGKITSLDVDKDGNVLVVDELALSVYVFDSSGSLIKKISQENCLVDIAWRPIAAKFMTNGKIFVLNNSRKMGILFRKDGKGVNVLPDEGGLPVNICVDDQDNLYSFYAREEGSYIIKTNIDGKKLATFGNFRKQFENLLSRHSGGGLVCGDGVIYQTTLVGTEVYIYNFNGVLINTMRIKPSFFRRIDSDISPGTKTALTLAQEIKTVLKGKTLIASLFLLDEDKLLLQYIHERSKIIIGVFDRNGKSVTGEGVLVDHYISLAKEGKAYIITQPGCSAPHFLDTKLTILNER